MLPESIRLYRMHRRYSVVLSDFGVLKHFSYYDKIPLSYDSGATKTAHHDAQYDS